MQLMLGHLRTAFYGRLCEWQAAVILFVWGMVLLMPKATFDGPGYHAFRLLIGEDMLGFLFMLGGSIRLGVLFANGAWRPMYYVRAWMALSSMVIWAAISMGFASAAGLGTWVAIYPVMTVFEAMNVFRAMGDAATAEREARRPVD